VVAVVSGWVGVGTCRGVAVAVDGDWGECEGWSVV